jgi:hypothetical protein
VKKVPVSIVVTLTAVTLVSCECSRAGGFSVYRLADDIPAIELLPVDLADLELQREPILSGDDIITYSWARHELELTAEAYERIQQLFTPPDMVLGIPFAVCVGPERVFAGAFWTAVSSLAFDGVIICQPLDPDKRIIRIGPGYPCREAFTGRDPRSDHRVRQSLEAAGKLK